jgi:RNA polymerase sigma-70 factor (ECF subfamily)
MPYPASILSALPGPAIFGRPADWRMSRPSRRSSLVEEWDRAIWLLSKAIQAISRDNDQAASAAASDWADIRETLQGSSDAYARLVSRYQQEIASQVWKYAPRPEVIEELVHDVFVEAYLSLRTFRGRAPFLHWLRKIAVRVGYRYWKSEAKRRAQTPVPTDAAAVGPTAASQHETADAAAQLYAVLERLSPRDRAVITLIHLEERSIAEVADLLDWSQAMVKVQAFRARRKIKKLLEAQ